ncbi:MAG TPA: hypothetical protein DIS80_02380 [Verrucomicrobiales bacterium]|nr:hypothetical protein [Verrucomicrobiales bacterium]
MIKLLITAALSLFWTAIAQETSQAKPKSPEKPKIERLNNEEVKIGKIHLHQKKRELSFKGGINMTKGLIEYFLATTKSDKVHETLILTDASPTNINIAMKLLGIKESKELFEIFDEETWKPTGKFPAVSPETHAASLVDIFVEWGKGAKKKRVPANELIHHINWPKKAPTPKPNEEFETNEATLSVMEEGPWLSTGSYMHEGRFKAEIGGIIFGIYTNEQAIVNFFGKDRLLGDVWIPNEKNVPKEGTVVTVVVKPHTPKK